MEEKEKDLVEVIRCKDCKYGIPAKGSDFYMCGKEWIKRHKDFYCGDGKVE